MPRLLQLLLASYSAHQWVPANGDSEACSAKGVGGGNMDELDVFRTAPFVACPQETLGLGLLWQKMGTTASGAAYYKAIDQPLWIYYDPSCDGKLGPLWVIGARPPSETGSSILSGDRQCLILADLPAKEFSNPLRLELGSHTWEFACLGFAKADLILETPPSPNKVHVHVSGSSAWMSCLNGDYEVAGVTKSGAKYYQSMFFACDGVRSYLYYDPSCGRSMDPAWVLALNKPDLNRFSSLGPVPTRCEDSADKCWKWSSFLPLGNSTWQLLTDKKGFAPWQLSISSEDLSIESTAATTGPPSQTMSPVPGDAAPSLVAQARSVTQLGVQQDVKALVASEFHGFFSHGLAQRYTDALTRASPTQRKTKTRPQVLLVLGPAGARKSFSTRFLAGLYRPPGAVSVSEEAILEESDAWKSSQELCETKNPGRGCNDLYDYFKEEVAKLQMAIQLKAVQEHWDLEFADTGADTQSTRQMIDTWIEHGYGLTAVGTISSEASCRSRAKPGRPFNSTAWQKSIMAIQETNSHLQARKQLVEKHGGSSVLTLLDDSGELPASSSWDSLNSLLV